MSLLLHGSTMPHEGTGEPKGFSATSCGDGIRGFQKPRPRCRGQPTLLLAPHCGSATAADTALAVRLSVLSGGADWKSQLESQGWGEGGGGGGEGGGGGDEGGGPCLNSKGRRLLTQQRRPTRSSTSGEGTSWKPARDWARSAHAVAFETALKPKCCCQAAGPSS